MSDDFASKTAEHVLLVAGGDDIRRLVRDLERDGFRVTEHDIRDMLAARSDHRERHERMQRQIAEAVKDIPVPVSIGFVARRGGGKRGQRGDARARRGAW